MTNATKMIAAYFESRGIRFELDEERDAIVTGWGMENFDSIRFGIFIKGDTTCNIRSSGFVKVPENKYDVAYKLLNKLNNDYMWAKFCLDEEDGMITINDDAVIQLDSCGEETERCCIQLCQIADEAYPEIQKAIWS